MPSLAAERCACRRAEAGLCAVACCGGTLRTPPARILRMTPHETKTPDTTACRGSLSVGRLDGLKTQLDLEADFPAVVVGVERSALVVVRGVGLQLEAVPDEVARHADGGLVPAAVAGQRLHLAVGEHRRVAQRDFPLLLDEVARLEVEALARVDEDAFVAVEERGVARAAHEVGIEGEAAVLEDEVEKVGPQVAVLALGHQCAVLALDAHGAAVVGVGASQQDAHLLLVFEVAFDDVALRLETPQRVELQASRIGQSAVGRRAPVAALAQRDGAFGREAEALADAAVVFTEESEVAVEVEFSVDDAAVDELQGTRRVDAGAVGLDFRLSEADVPVCVGYVVDDCVADDVRVAVGQLLGVVGSESELDGVDQLGRVDVTVEAQAQPLDARLGLREREVAVEREPHHVLHAEAQRHRVPLAPRLEGDALAYLDVGHHAQQFEQLLVGVLRVGESRDAVCGILLMGHFEAVGIRLRGAVDGEYGFSEQGTLLLGAKSRCGGQTQQQKQDTVFHLGVFWFGKRFWLTGMVSFRLSSDKVAK